MNLRFSIGEYIVKAALGEEAGAARLDVEAGTDVDPELGLGTDTRGNIITLGLSVVHASSADQVGMDLARFGRLEGVDDISSPVDQLFLDVERRIVAVLAVGTVYLNTNRPGWWTKETPANPWNPVLKPSLNTPSGMSTPPPSENCACARATFALASTPMRAAATPVATLRIHSPF